MIPLQLGCKGLDEGVGPRMIAGARRVFRRGAGILGSVEDLVHFVGGQLVRNGSNAFFGAERFARERLELLEAGQLLKIAEAETHQKFLGGAIQNGAADDFLAASGGDEPLVEEVFNTPLY